MGLGAFEELTPHDRDGHSTTRNVP
jgi:hypothetical protein